MKKLLLIFSLLFSFSSYAANPIYTKIFSSKAVDGYDVVSYFTEGKPTKGNQQFHTEYQGATWLFSSKENLALFKQGIQPNMHLNMVVIVHGQLARIILLLRAILSIGKSLMESSILTTTKTCKKLGLLMYPDLSPKLTTTGLH